MFSVSVFVTALLFLSATTINGGHSPSKILRVPSIKGRLLTPQEGCGFTKVRTTKIVGGSYAKDGAWPWMVAVGYYHLKHYKLKCGGTLITSRHVLTAGHCIRHDISNMFVRLGALNRLGPQREVKVIHAEKHPNYKKSSGTDIGILYLDHDVEFNNRIRPICLPIDEPMQSQSFVGKNPFVAGWGKTSENAHRASYFLKQLQMPVLNNSLCKKLYQNAHFHTVQFSDDLICAGNLAGGDGFCNGDSGGPLMLPIQQNGSFSFYLIGVVSFSMDCGHKNSPDGYVDVPHHSDWIQEMIANGNNDIE